jgi:hypothetical protein
MAEIAIPLIALGSMYIISNQDKQKEKFENMNIQTHRANALPNVEPIPINYPITQPVKEDNVKQYLNPNQVTDKYFSPQTYTPPKAKTELDGAPKFVSLSGIPIDSNDFKHNNMTPYFGAKIRGATIDTKLSENILDNMQGTGSQQFKKKEVAPLFKPQENVEWSFGMPNQSDFYQSRMNPSMRMANIKPWEEQQVAPGLDQGYTVDGALGFNSGMGARDKWLDRNVDELRVKTNPKVSYGLQGHEGPAGSLIKDRGIIGTVEKHLPDTYYHNTPDRWLTTTGIEKAQTSRGIELLHNVNRTSTTQEYFGTMGNSADGEAGYAPQNFRPSNRTETAIDIVSAPSVAGKNPATTGDFGRQGYNFLPTNRTTTCTEEVGIVGGFVKAVVAPILDVLRPTRKENVVGNARQYENVKSMVPSGSVYNPADRTKTTNREMTEGKLDNNHLNINGQSQNSDGYLVSKQQAIHNNRDTTNVSYVGNSMGIVQNGDAYLVSDQTPIHNNRDTTTTSYTGSSGGYGTQQGPRTYNAEYNQHNNVNKTYMNRPNQGGTQMFNQTDNIKINKLDTDRDNNRLWVRGSGSSVTTVASPSIETYGMSQGRQTYNENIQCDRIQPDILTAFKQNPYTQSLQSWA